MTLSTNEKRVFALHLSYSILEGIMAGAVVLNEFIFLKSMHGSNYMLSFLWQFSALVLLPSFIFTEYLKRKRNKRNFLRTVALLTRAPMLILLLFPSDMGALSGHIIYHYLFLAIFLNYYLAWPLVLPTVNFFLKNNYSHQNFGSLFSIASSAKNIATLAGTFIAGLLLDNDPFAFRYIYPLIGVMGFSSVFLLTRIPKHKIENQEKKKAFLHEIPDISKRSWLILWKQKPYRDFEIAFMIYGLAFMITISVITIFLEKEMKLSYSDLAFYKNTAVLLATVLFPFFGKMLGNTDPRKFGTLPFAALAFYILFIMLAANTGTEFELAGFHIQSSLLIAFVFFGLFSATMTLLWSIGSAYFCKQEDAGAYQSIHLSLTGFRAMFAPTLGVFFYEQFGYNTTFIIAISLLTLGIIYLWRSLYKHRNSIE